MSESSTPRSDEAYILRLLGRIADLERALAQSQARCAEVEKVLRQVQGGTWSMTSIDAALKEPR